MAPINQLSPVSTPFNPLLLGFRLTIIAVVFWIVVRVIQVCDLSHSTTKSIMLVLVLITIPALMSLVPRPNHPVSRRITLVLAIGCAALVCLHFLYFVLQFCQRPLQLNDIATTTLSAVDALVQGKNPYTLPIDAEGSRFANVIGYDGYKYMPMMAVTYLPLGAVLRERGILITNLLMDLATLVLIFRLGSRIESRQAGLFAALLYLMVTVVPFEIFKKGSTDLATIVPLLVALLYVNRNSGLAGFCVGLSMSMKLLPGAIFVICCLPFFHRRWYAAGIALGLVPTLVFLALSPVDLLNNTVLFNAKRSVDSTTWLYRMPPEIGLLAKVIFIVAALSACVYVWFKHTTILTRCGIGVACLLGVMLSGPIIHRNYNVWWVPVFAVILGVAAFRYPVWGSAKAELAPPESTL